MRIEGDRMDELKDVESAAASGPGGGSLSMGGIGGRNGSGVNNSGLQYSIPGILHFLQHEWSRFEMERGQWEVERAELNVSFLILYWPYECFSKEILPKFSIRLK